MGRRIHYELRSSLLAWLETVEGLFLLNPEALEAQRNKAEDLLSEAQKAGWVTTQVAPTLMSLGQMSEAEVIDSIRKSSGDRERLNVRQCGDAILRWIGLERSTVGAVRFEPRALDCLLTAVAQRRHSELALIIGMVANVIEKATIDVASEIVQTLNSPLEDLLREASYGDDADDHRSFGIGVTMSVRVNCGRLAAAARQRDLRSQAIDKWTTAVADDLFQDVRNSVHH